MPMAMQEFGTHTIDPREIAAVGRSHPAGPGNPIYTVDVSLRGGAALSVAFATRDAAEAGRKALIAAASGANP
jgi:hypothetical protein